MNQCFICDAEFSGSSFKKHCNFCESKIIRRLKKEGKNEYRNKKIL